MPVSMLGLWTKVGGKWAFNDDKLETRLRFVQEVGRPLVMYLMANHFDTENSISEELLHDLTGIS